MKIYGVDLARAYWFRLYLNSMEGHSREDCLLEQFLILWGPSWDSRPCLAGEMDHLIVPKRGCKLLRTDFMYPVRKGKADVCLETLTIVELYGEVDDTSNGQKDVEIEFSDNDALLDDDDTIFRESQARIEAVRLCISFMTYGPG